MARRIIMREVPAGKRRSADDLLAEIRQLYFRTTRQTIERDFDRAIDLLKAMPEPADRQRATVFMEGLAEMRKEWKPKRPPLKKTRARRGP